MVTIFENPWLEFLTEWMEGLFANKGAFMPILLLAIEESGIPLPIPGDVMIAYTGYNVSKGLLDYPVAIIALITSVMLGSSVLYWLSVNWGNILVIKFGKFLHLHPQRLATVEKTFNKYGPWVIIFGRHIPGFRIPITVFAGMSNIKYRTFILSTFASTFFWIIFYLDLGIRLGPKVKNFLKISSSHWIILLAVAASIIFGFVVYRRNKYTQVKK